MSQFRKKPIVIEAMQFTPDTARECLAFIGSNWWDNPSGSEPAGLYGNNASGPNTFVAVGLWVRTLEGDMDARPGDWIIRGVKGEFYPVKNDIFLETYEPADPTREPVDAGTDDAATIERLMQILGQIVSLVDDGKMDAFDQLPARIATLRQQARREGIEAAIAVVRGQIASIQRIAAEPLTFDTTRAQAKVRVDALEGVEMVLTDLLSQPTGETGEG